MILLFYFKIKEWMSLWTASMYYNNIHSYNYVSCTNLWYGIYRKSGGRDGQTNNFYFFLLVMDQKTCLQLGPPPHDVYKVPIHTYAEEWEVVGRQLCAFCARWIVFKFIMVVSHAPLLNYFQTEAGWQRD